MNRIGFLYNKLFGKKSDDGETYTLTPKAIAAMSAYEAGLITDIHDPRFKTFWEEFEVTMRECGWVED